MNYKLNQNCICILGANHLEDFRNKDGINSRFEIISLNAANLSIADKNKYSQLSSRQSLLLNLIHDSSRHMQAIISTDITSLSPIELLNICQAIGNSNQLPQAMKFKK